MDKEKIVGVSEALLTLDILGENSTQDRIQVQIHNIYYVKSGDLVIRSLDLDVYTRYDLNELIKLGVGKDSISICKFMEKELFITVIMNLDNRKINREAVFQDCCSRYWEEYLKIRAELLNMLLFQSMSDDFAFKCEYMEIPGGLTEESAGMYRIVSRGVFIDEGMMEIFIEAGLSE